MADLKAATRNALPASDFAIPSTRDYPIEDIGHARDALSRVAEDGTPAEQAQVRNAVHAKYPSIGEGDTGAGAPAVARKVQAERMAEHQSRSASAG
jgi:hypothetical protein